ncbi:ABC transporter permease [Agromyces seonyuensis]|uniref:Oligopeptide transport system permease protein OppC n=1 Tax=Agromyces seonyuensis TaxID=2662446 RepID=A0A6I4NVJ3_9MICO|nr:ABC transporter permease [Agromyces seonyuensis]MWB98131.1 ABC transporter permease subunit [Agromyces seonyuensis]
MSLNSSIIEPIPGEPTPDIDGTPVEDRGPIDGRDTKGLSQGQIVRKRFFRHRAAVISLAVLVFVIVLSYSSVGLHVGGLHLAGWWPWHWTTPLPVVDRGHPTLNLVPGPDFGIGPHPFGQDEIGRDVFAIVMRGAQQSIMIMVIVGIVSTFIGIVFGALSGYYRGWVDSVLMRFTDVIITIPFLVVGAVIGNMIGNLGAALLAVGLGLFSWTSLARIIRGEFLSLREREFVDAARLSGASDRRIIFKHILPNSIGVITVSATLAMAAAILGETALSYIGFGVKPPDTSLGTIISENQAAFNTRPWIFWWPGVFIVSIALCVNFIGDGLRDAFDPRQKKMPSARAFARAASRQALRDHRAATKSAKAANGAKV